MGDSRPAAFLDQPQLADLALASLVAGLSMIGAEMSLAEDMREAPAPTWGGMALLLIGALALSVRRAAPVAVLAVAATTSFVYHALGYRPLPLPLAVLVALYTVAQSRALLGAGAAGVYVLAMGAASLRSPLPLDDDHAFTYLVAVVATVTVGYGVALGRARATLAEQRAARLIAEQDTRTRAAVEQEQSRISREVHDIVAHDVSVIVAQARAARGVFDRDPETAAAALASIESIGRDALDGLRRLMGLLRAEPEADGRTPQPRLEDLPQLIEQVRRAGLPVELTIRGRPRLLPATLELNAYRIVQEALTNSLKHAGPTHATVVLGYSDDHLLVEVRDEGPGSDSRPVGAGAGPPGTGYGLVSMRQRVAMHGGHLDARAGEDAGFRVSVRLPVRSGSA